MSAKMLSAGLAHDKMLESIVMTSESSEENNDELKDRLANWFLTVREPRVTIYPYHRGGMGCIMERRAALVSSQGPWIRATR